MNNPRIRDDMIVEAFDRRARRAMPVGLRGPILEATTSSRQRRSLWNIRDSGTSLRLLAVAALLVTGLGAGTIFVGRPLVADTPTTTPVAEPTTAPVARESDRTGGRRRTCERRTLRAKPRRSSTSDLSSTAPIRPSRSKPLIRE